MSVIDNIKRGLQGRIHPDEIAYIVRAIETPKRELKEARKVVVDLLPDEFSDLLRGERHELKTFDDFYVWEHEVIEAVIAGAEYNEHGRAACPLCRSRGQSFRHHRDGTAWWPLRDSDIGYLRGGLDMHLRGTGNVKKCGVFWIAHDVLRDEYYETFRAAEEAAKQTEAEALALRMKTDPLVLIDPNRAPALAAKPWHYKSRASDAWPAVEARLREIGFAIEKADNVTTYKYMIDEYRMVLADPRDEGKVLFRGFYRAGKDAWKANWSNHEDLILRDDWTDWPAKFRERLAERLPQPKRRSMARGSKIGMFDALDAQERQKKEPKP